MGICLPDMPGVGGPRFTAHARDRIAAYLREHGPSTAKEIAGGDIRERNCVLVCLASHGQWFEKTGEKKKWGAEVWRLKSGAR